MGALLKWILTLKSRMPLNGDWIFVTETPSKGQIQDNDLAAKHDSPEKVLKSLASDNQDSIKLLYDRAKTYESRIQNIGNLTRDKAKTLLGTVSVVTAVFFGAATFFSSGTSAYPRWAMLIELLLFLLLSTQLIHSLIIAMDVMTRETSIIASFDEMLKRYSNRDGVNTSLLMAYKDAIAQMIAYSNQSHFYINSRVNQLILGQHSYRYGLFYFAILIIFHVCVSMFYIPPNPMKLLNHTISLQQSMLEVVDRDQKNISSRVDDISANVSVLNSLIKTHAQLETRLSEIEKAVTQLRNEMQQTAKGKRQILKKPRSVAATKKK
jgi:hypothetical protein